MKKAYLSFSDLILLLLVFHGMNLKAQELIGTVTSPAGLLSYSFYSYQNDQGATQLFYEVTYKGKEVVKKSSLDIEMDNHLSELALALKPDSNPDWSHDLELTGIARSTKDTTWNPVYGERSSIRNNYNQVIIKFQKKNTPHYRLNLIVRAYNSGIAFKYAFPLDSSGVYYHITSENTQFTFPDSTFAYFTEWAQGNYQKIPLKDWPDKSERPLTLTLPSGLYVSLAEADMVDYARTKFKLTPDKKNTVETSLYGAVDRITPFATPWRVIMVAKRSGDLIEHDDLILNLNKPNQIKNTDWIQPGKEMRVMTFTDKDAKTYIDFAADHNLRYVLFDWRWYGPTLDFNSDARTINVDMDLKKWIKYAHKKGVGVFLYVNQQALLKQMDEIFPLYHKWGVAGIKFGFVQVGSHRWTVWLQNAIKKAAENHLMVDIHDEYRPTGEQRTFPNIVTAEGVRGNEEMPDATHNTILPFTRMIAGPADYTICYYSNRIETTHAHQLALSVIYYSPLQTLFWYDSPSDYQGEKEIHFFEKVPTTWNESKVVNGEIGKYITMARRKGEEWFVGSITNNDGREVSIPLDFLKQGRTYTAHIYTDNDFVDTRTHVAFDKKELTKSDVLKLDLKPSGGVAIWMKPDSN